MPYACTLHAFGSSDCNYLTKKMVCWGMNETYLEKMLPYGVLLPFLTKSKESNGLLFQLIKISQLSWTVCANQELRWFETFRIFPETWGQLETLASWNKLNRKNSVGLFDCVGGHSTCGRVTDHHPQKVTSDCKES